MSSIDGETRLTGLIGWPVAHSLSPAMHNAAFERCGLNWRYVPLPARAERLAEALRGLAALGFCGANVTVPHKVAVMPHLDAIDPAALGIGAVNTIVVDGETGRLTGHNTDAAGFLSDLEAHGLALTPGAHVLILGAGGAARAVAYAVLGEGATVSILNRTHDRAERLVAALHEALPGAAVQAVRAADLMRGFPATALIVNATSAGMWPDVNHTPWPYGVPYPEGAALYDTVYRPAHTRLMREAETNGLRVVGGLGMLVRQGAAAFSLWTGIDAPVDVMEAACQRALDGAMWE
ncbi:MAG: shikimate dehydrogenase [Anaerolineae bacterium]|nr:shikimate dehydrogenase [Anaerolineae bacterium]